MSVLEIILFICVITLACLFITLSLKAVVREI